MKRTFFAVTVLTLCFLLPPAVLTAQEDRALIELERDSIPGKAGSPYPFSINTGGRISIMLFPPTEGENALALLTDLSNLLFSLRGGSFIQANLHFFGFLEMGPELALLYMSWEDAESGSTRLNLFDIPVRLNLTARVWAIRLTAFAGHNLGGGIGPDFFKTSGLWEAGARLALGPLTAEYSYLYSPNGHVYGTDHRYVTRAGLGWLIPLF